jgi:uncharacterized protein YlxW (UPF0749 family)
MKIRTTILILFLVALTAFTLVNWQAITAPTRVSLILTEVQAPIGLLMLFALVLMAAMFTAYLIVQQAGVIMETRRTAKELRSHRELADKAEASRFTDLRSFLESELRSVRSELEREHAAIEGRLDGLEKLVGETAGESTRTLSAYLGEIEDKLDRRLGASPP